MILCKGLAPFKNKNKNKQIILLKLARNHKKNDQKEHVEFYQKLGYTRAVRHGVNGDMNLNFLFYVIVFLSN